MYLPLELPKAKVLVTVKTYPNSSRKYDELVCNAGFIEPGKWIRIYPVRFLHLPLKEQFNKFNWIELDLVRRDPKDDFRQESYSPRLGIDESIRIIDHLGTGKDRQWSERKRYALNEVFDSMTELIELSKTPSVWKSLATVKPQEILRLEVEQQEREWDQDVQSQLRQLNLFEDGFFGGGSSRQVVRKLPYRYYYRILTKGDPRPRRLMIEDWEIGALYWNCLAQTDGDEVAANELVRQKYEDEFLTKDIYLFVGTSLRYHKIAPNPFMIIGVFYPGRTQQPELPLSWT